jgi:hypothetical protein
MPYWQAACLALRLSLAEVAHYSRFKVLRALKDEEQYFLYYDILI